MGDVTTGSSEFFCYSVTQCVYGSFSSGVRVIYYEEKDVMVKLCAMANVNFFNLCTAYFCIFLRLVGKSS